MSFVFLGMYYLRTKAAASAIQFTVDKTKLKTGEAVKNGAKAPGSEETSAKIQVFLS